MTTPAERLTLPTRAELSAMVRGDEESVRLTKEFLPSLVVESNEDFRKASAILLSIKSAYAEIKERHDRIVDPIKVGLSHVTELFSPALRGFLQAEEYIKGKLATWNLRVEGLREADAMAGRPVELAPPEAEGITIIARWDFEVENVDVVPREFCAPDPRKIRAAVEKGYREIDGVRIFRDDTVRASAKTRT